MVSQWDQGACPRNTWYPNIAVRPFKLQEMQLPVFFLHHGGWAWWRQVWAARNVELIALCEASANMVLLQSMESMGLQCILWASYACCLKKLKPIWHALPSPAGRDQQLLWLPERPEFTMECMESKGSKASATTENQTSLKPRQKQQIGVRNQNTNLSDQNHLESQKRRSRMMQRGQNHLHLKVLRVFQSCFTTCADLLFMWEKWLMFHSSWCVLASCVLSSRVRRCYCRL